MIHFTHVYKTYPGPVHALRNINIKIEKGEFVFLTGPSGAGKTTLFRMISGYDRPSSGHIEVAGYDLTEINSRELPFFRRQIGVVFQDFRLLKSRTIFDNVALPLQILGETAGLIQHRVHEILEQVGLINKIDQFPEQLSGGEQQRVAIARAVIHQPACLIADEPTGNLDNDLRDGIVALLERVNSQGTTVFIATHDQDLVQKRKRKVIHLREGEVSC